MLCMQVVNEHHRQHDVWSWRKLNQWSPFTRIKSALHCLKVFTSNTRKTDGGSTSIKGQERTCVKAREEKKENKNLFWDDCCHIKADSTKSALSPRIPVTSNTHITWLLRKILVYCTWKHDSPLKNPTLQLTVKHLLFRLCRFSSLKARSCVNLDSNFVLFSSSFQRASSVLS